MNTSTFTNPVRGQVYGIEEISKLRLRDTPFLRIDVKTLDGITERTVIQTSHFTSEEKVAEALAGLQFKYEYETDEWIPLFLCVSPQEEILRKVHVELDLCAYVDSIHDKDPDEAFCLFAYPKGVVREQYYTLAENDTKIISPYRGEPYVVCDKFKEVNKGLKSFLTQFE